MAKATGKQIREAVEYWRLALGLEDWTYTIQIGRLPGGDYGSAEVNLPYKRVHFRFWPQGMAEMKESVDGMAAHEWLHCLVEPLALKAKHEDLEEGLVTELERLVLRLHKRPRSD